MHFATKPRIQLFGVGIDAVRLKDAVASVLENAHVPGPCRYVVTPNLNHSLQLLENEGLRRAYAGAWLVIADGWPVVFASRLFGDSLPERVTGSDLVPAVFAASSREKPIRVFLLGALPGVAERAARRIELEYPGVRVVGTNSPPFGFEHDPRENALILEQIAKASPDLLVVGLGAPKQELWTYTHREKIEARVALCVGGTIDFLAGDLPRAPEWAKRVGVEWAHRMIAEPRRLVPRYARNAIGFPRLLIREWLSRF